MDARGHFTFHRVLLPSNHNTMQVTNQLASKQIIAQELRRHAVQEETESTPVNLRPRRPNRQTHAVTSG